MSASIMKLFSVVFLLLPLSACWAEVVMDFTVKCPQFFPDLNGQIAPLMELNGDRYRKICQTLNNKVYFATLYDTKSKIPVYSAYKFQTPIKRCRLDCWFIEPQLEEGPYGKNMARESDVPNISNQARNSDYGNGYDRGHLAPVNHCPSQEWADATFTLTNAAPQASSFNRRWFHRVEKKMANHLIKNCTNRGLQAYIVTGVVPGNGKLKNMVKIPSHFWSAFCCFDNNQRANYSGSYLGKNHNDSVPTEQSIKVLEANFKSLYQQDFILFNGKCSV